VYIILLAFYYIIICVCARLESSVNNHGYKSHIPSTQTNNVQTFENNEEAEQVVQPALTRSDAFMTFAPSSTYETHCGQIL
jgi:hypothetical protein